MKKNLLLSVFLFLTLCISGQNSNLTIQINQILFKDLVDTIETLTPVKVYFSDKWVDSLYLDVKAENKSLDEILNSSLRKQGLSFIITDDNRVILSKGYSIKTTFGKEYLEYLKKKDL